MDRGLVVVSRRTQRKGCSRRAGSREGLIVVSRLVPGTRAGGRQGQARRRRQRRARLSGVIKDRVLLPEPGDGLGEKVVERRRERREVSALPRAVVASAPPGSPVCLGTMVTPL